MDCTFNFIVPSKCDLFLEYDGAQDGGYDHAERVEGRDEHRASLPRHETLHVVGHAGAHNALEGSITQSMADAVRGRRHLQCTRIIQ